VVGLAVEMTPRTTVDVALSQLTLLPVGDIGDGYSPRDMRLDAGHVAALMEVIDRLPPVLVDQRTMSVIDGVHRLAAFRMVGRSHIEAHLFAGSETEAMVLAIQANIKHGKPLSRAERRMAAQALLHACPERSDRWFGEVCGLSHTTVALIRKTLNTVDVRVRTGRDGRRRPVDTLAGQMSVARVVAENPSTTVRDAAAAAGVAPSTAHRVRARLRRREEIPALAMALAMAPSTERVEALTRLDVRTPSAEPEAGAASWLAVTTVNMEDLHTHLESLPLSRVYEVADECRRRAKTWVEIAEALERRTRIGSSANRRP
jgi:ParB-like chromosome segregation protein Spo0J